MPNPLLAMTSDWHLAPGAWRRPNTPKGDSYFALRQIVDYCLDQHICLVGAGDLFDVDRPDPMSLLVAFEQVARLSAAGLRLFFTQGQHERASPAYLSLVPQSFHIHRSYVLIDGLRVYGLDHTPADSLAKEIEAVPGNTDLLVCHQVWSNFMGVGAEGDLSSLSEPGAPGIVLTGDFHDHRILPVGGCRAFSPGSTCLQDIGEPRDKAFFVLNDDLTVASVTLKTRKVSDVLIQNESELEEFLAKAGEFAEWPTGLPEDIRKPVVSVRCGNVDQAYRRVVRAVGEKVHLFWKATFDSSREVLYDGQEAAARAPQGLIGCLPLVTPQGGHVYNSVLRLLGAADKKAALASMGTEFGV